VFRYKPTDKKSACIESWAQLGGRDRGRVPPLSQTVGIQNAMLLHIFLLLSFAIYWFHVKLSPSHFTTNLRSCIELSSYKVLTVKFQASTLDQCHLSCKSDSKPFDAVTASSVVCLSPPISHLSNMSSRPPLRLRLHSFYTLRMYANTAHSTETEQQLFSEALTSNVGLLQNFRAYKKWISSSNF